MKKVSLLAFTFVILATIVQLNRSCARSELVSDTRARLAELKNIARIQEQESRIQNVDERRNFRVREARQSRENFDVNRNDLVRTNSDSREEARRVDSRLTRQDRSVNRRVVQEEQQRESASLSSRVRQETRVAPESKSRQLVRIESRQLTSTDFRNSLENTPNQVRLGPAVREVRLTDLETRQSRVRGESGRFVREERVKLETQRLAQENTQRASIRLSAARNNAQNQIYERRIRDDGSVRVQGDRQREDSRRINREMSRTRQIVREERQDTPRIVRDNSNRLESTRFENMLQTRGETRRFVREDRVRDNARVQSRITQDRGQDEPRRIIARESRARIADTVRDQRESRELVREDRVDRESPNQRNARLAASKDFRREVRKTRHISETRKESRRVLPEERSHSADSRRTYREVQIQDSRKDGNPQDQIRNLPSRRIVSQREEEFRVAREVRVSNEKERAAPRVVRQDANNKIFNDVRDTFRGIIKNEDGRAGAPSKIQNERDVLLPASKIDHFTFDNFGNEEKPALGWNQLTSAVFGGAALLILHYQRQNVKFALD